MRESLTLRSQYKDGDAGQTSGPPASLDERSPAEKLQERIKLLKMPGRQCGTGGCSCVHEIVLAMKAEEKQKILLAATGKMMPRSPLPGQEERGYLHDVVRDVSDSDSDEGWAEPLLELLKTETPADRSLAQGILKALKNLQDTHFQDQELEQDFGQIYAEIEIHFKSNELPRDIKRGLVGARIRMIHAESTLDKPAQALSFLSMAMQDAELLEKDLAKENAELGMSVRKKIDRIADKLKELLKE